MGLLCRLHGYCLVAMNKKTISILIIFVIVLVVLFVWFDITKPIEQKTSTTTEITDSPVVVAHNIGSVSLPIRTSPSDEETSDIKVIASSPEEAEKLAKDFYKDMFSVVTEEDGYILDVYSGDSISVNNFYSETETPSQFVPLFSNNKVVGVSIFREYTADQRELGRMSEITAEWYSYPPVSFQEAEHKFLSSNPSLYYKIISGYYFIEDGETPYYLFKNNEDSEKKCFLVSAYDKNIITKDSKLLNEAHQEKLPVKLDENGLIAVDM